MREVPDILSKQLAQSRAEVENAVAWFYALFLSEPSDQSTIERTSLILFPRDRAKLSAPKGKHEAAALKNFSTLKKAFLSAQLHDIVEAYADSLRMREGARPEAVRQRLGERLDRFGRETAELLAKEVQRCFLRGFPVQETARNLSQLFGREASAAGAYAAVCYAQAGRYLALEASGSARFRFVSEKAEGTCARCSGLDGGLYTLDALAEKGLLPPLHPNCRCQVVPAEEAKEGEGGVPPWLARYLSNLARIPSDAKAMLDAYTAAQLERAGHATGVSGLADGGPCERGVRRFAAARAGGA